MNSSTCGCLGDLVDKFNAIQGTITVQGWDGSTHVITIDVQNVYTPAGGQPQNLPAQPPDVGPNHPQHVKKV